jgi:hypothetical protein
MAENTNENKSVKSFKIIVILLAFTMLGSLYYIYKSSDRDRNTIINLRQEKSIVLKDLEKSELFLNQIMTTNKSLSAKLMLEKEKVAKLITDLKTKPVTEKIITIYKQDANNVDNRIKLLLQEIQVYKTRIDSTNVVLKIEKNKNDTLVTTNKKLTKRVTDASKLYFYNLQTSYFKVKSSGKQIETDKASRADLIKVSFMIAENDFAKSFKKVYYVQIIDPKNNILGRKETKTFGSESLNFGAVVPVYYQNKTTKGETDIVVKDLEDGNYTINIFDKAKLILTSNFILK